MTPSSSAMDWFVQSMILVIFSYSIPFQMPLFVLLCFFLQDPRFTSVCAIVQVLNKYFLQYYDCLRFEIT